MPNRTFQEHWDQGHEEDTTFPNKWPADSDLADFRPFMQAFYRSCEGVSFQLLQALELGLGLPPATFRSRIHNASELRMNHYPPISIESLREGSVGRIWPHFDLGVLTMLWTAGSSGLEFQNRLDNTEGSRSFIPVVPVSRYEIILNISETLQRWTNDVLPAGLHQVTTPPDLKGASEGVIGERFSIAYFCKADRGTSVGTLPPFVHPVEGAKYEDITALEYHQSRLRTAY
jgi:isopenicillin N synthase-like dioxygenase